MALFTIHYENSKATSITYRLDGIEKTESIEHLLCSFINSFEYSHRYFRPENENERNKIVYSDASIFITEPNNYDQHNSSFGSPFDIYTDNILPLSGIYLKFAEKLRNKVIQDNVYYFLNENKLVFDESINLQESSYLGLSNDEFSHIRTMLHFDPSLFSLYKHFLSIKNDFVSEIKNNIIQIPYSYNMWQKLFLQSDEYINNEFKNFLYLCKIDNSAADNNNYIWSDFGVRSDIVSFCTEYSFAKNPFDFSFSRAHKYQTKKTEMFRAYYCNNQDKICTDYSDKLFSDIQITYNSFISEKRINKKEIQKILNKSNRLIIDAFYSPEKHGLAKSVSFSNNEIQIEYEDFSSGKTSLIVYPYPYTLDKIFQPIFGYNYNKAFISPTCAMYMAFSGGKNNNPFMYPIVHSDFDMYEYVNVMPFHHYSYMVKDLEEIMNIDYHNATFDLDTNSLLRVLVCLFETVNKDDSKIKKCLQCGKYFVALTGYDKYCDAALRKEIKNKIDYDSKNSCSYIAKQKQTKNREAEIKELQSCRRNEQYYLLRETDYFNLDIPVFHDRYNSEKKTLLATDITELEAVTLKLFSALRCGILLCKYDKIKKQISKALSTSIDNKDIVLKYGKSLLNHSFTKNDLPNKKKKICYYYNKIDLFPYYFDWEEEIKIITNKDYNSVTSVKIKERIDLMYSMITSYTIWSRDNSILSSKTDISSNVMESIEFLNKTLPKELSINKISDIKIKNRKHR